jgi:hypothetical protein
MFFSKLFQRKLWWFCGISTCYKGSKPKCPLSKFFVAPASVRPCSERRRATFRRLSRSDPSVFSGSSCCGTAGRTFRPSLNFVSQNSSIARIRFQGKPKGESVVGQFEFSTSNATGLARQECAHLRRSADGRRNSKQMTGGLTAWGDSGRSLSSSRRKRWVSLKFAPVGCGSHALLVSAVHAARESM